MMMKKLRNQRRGKQESQSCSQSKSNWLCCAICPRRSLGLNPAEVLDKGTRSGKSAETSQPQPAQSIPKKKRKHHVRKLKESPCVIAEY
jgi:hypothetical protein